MKFISGLAAATLALAFAATSQAAPAQAPEYVSIVQETTIDAPAATAWSRLDGYCDIGKWLSPATVVPCEITSGRDGELGAVRRIANAVDEALVARTPMSYTYAEIGSAIFYHGAVEVRPVDAKTSRLLYSIVYDQATIPADRRDAEKAGRASLFAGVLKAMKAAAEAK